MDWQDLRHFAAVARAGSLSAAARDLGVDHATVSRRVAALEQDLRLKLIDRLPRQARLTQDGHRIAALALQIETATQQIERHARGASTAPEAIVRLNAPPAVAARLVAPHVAAFHKNNPGITLHLAGEPMLAPLDRGEADIALRLSRPKDAGLVASRIGVMRFGLYATRDVAACPPETWRFIAYDAPLDHITQQVWLKSLLQGRPIVFRASDLFGQHEAARAGLGALVLPIFMGDSDPLLVPLPTTIPAPTRDIWLATYPDLRRSPAIRTVMDFVRHSVDRHCPLRDKAAKAPAADL